MIGQVIGNYEVVDKIGQGGMGTVYRARDRRLQRFVALKILPTEIADQDTRRRFLQEARAASSLDHPGIVTIYDILEHDGQDVIVMELVRGESIRREIRVGGTSLNELLQIAIPLAEAVSAAHHEGITHRDLKPDNVMLTPDGRIKLLDFGLAKLSTAPVIPSRDDSEEIRSRRSIDEARFLREENAEIETALLTIEGTTAGTAAYMAPEQAVGEAIDPRTDVFAFGVMLYELCCGRRPFKADSLPQLLDQVVNQAPPSLRKLRPDLPGILVEVIAKAMHKSPDERYQDIDDMVEDLRLIESTAQDPTTRITRSEAGLLVLRLPWWRRPKVRRRVVQAAAATAMIVAVVYLGLLVRQRTERPSVAVIGFNNIVGDPQADWLSTALVELLHGQLAGGGEIRLIPGARVNRLKQELAILDHNSYDLETLGEIRRNLDVRHVVNGSYLLQGDRISIQIFLQDTRNGDLDTALQAEGAAADIFDLSQQLGRDLRRELGTEELTAPEAQAIRAAVSAQPEAAELYFQGLEQLQTFNADGARRSLEQAVEIDADYALAHSALGRAWAKLGYDGKARGNIERAFELRENLPERQARQIEARYYELIGDWNKAIAAYRGPAQQNPEDLDLGLQWITAMIASGDAERGEEAALRLDELRLLDPPAGTDPRIDLLAAELAHARSDFAAQAEAADFALAEARNRRARWLQAEASYQQAVALFGLGQFDEALEASQRGIDLFLDLGAREQAVRVMITQANVFKNRGEINESERVYREALAVARQTGDRDQTSTILNNLSLLQRDRGDLDEARKMLRESLQLAREIGDRRRVAVRWNTLGGIELLLGRLEEAREMARTALEIDREVERPWGIVWDLDLLGRIAHAAGEDVAAEGFLEEALALCETHDLRSLSARVRTDLATLRIDQNRLDEAAELLEAAAATQADLGEKGPAVRTLRLRAELHLAGGRLDAAEQAAQDAQRELIALDLTDEEILTSALLARLKLQRGEPSVASALFQRSQIQAESSENFIVRTQAALTTAAVKAASGDQAGADALAQEIEREASARGFVRLARQAREL